MITHTWGASTGTFLKICPLRAIPGTPTSVLHRFFAVAKFMRYKKARRIGKLGFHAITTDAEIGKCRLLSQPPVKNLWQQIDRQTNKHEATFWNQFWIESILAIRNVQLIRFNWNNWTPLLIFSSPDSFHDKRSLFNDATPYFTILTIISTYPLWTN